MLKFKNKFKFGSSAGAESDQSSQDLRSDSPRNSTDLRKTISMSNLAEGMLRVSLGDRPEATRPAAAAAPQVPASGALPDRATITAASAASAATSGATSTAAPTAATAAGSAATAAGSTATAAGSTATAAGSKAATVATAPTTAGSPAGSPAGSSATTPGGPGLLTVKIYTLQSLHLPIAIQNNKQILQALASNANNENTTHQLWKNLSSLQTQEQAAPPPRDVLLGAICANFLPAVITIPNGENLVKSLLYLTIEFDNNVLVIEPQRGTVSLLTWNQVVSFDVGGAAASAGAAAAAAGKFLNLSLFIRLPSMLIPESERADKAHLFTNAAATGGAGHMGDLLIGTIKLPLSLGHHAAPTRLMNHEYLKFRHLSLPDDMGEIMLTVDFKPIVKKPLSIDDFDLLKVIGKGSFGKVMQVIKKDTKQIYALKTLRKQHIILRMEVTHTLAERTVLARINNPFIVPLKFLFQSREKLYLVLSFINGGELFWHLQKEGKFLMDRLRFYIAELLTALESLHDLNVIYRDLKPENILLDYQGHIALCDFGLCKLNMANDDKTNTFCGTPEYLAPELLLNQGYTRSVDWWTLGTLLYEMLTGLPPFYDDDVNTMYGKILRNPLRFPDALEGTDAQDLLVKLLQKDPAMRLSDATQIKLHRFFLNIDWGKLLAKSYLPPFKPNVENLFDTSNFDQDFTNEKPQDLVVDDFLSESVQKQFGGWTYNGDTMLA
jgi:serum/glucocorticoid-regulated kinase 2